MDRLLTQSGCAVFEQQSLDLVEMLKREEVMLAAVQAANEEVCITKHLQHDVGTSFLNWEILGCVSVAYFSTCLWKCH